MSREGYKNNQYFEDFIAYEKGRADKMSKVCSTISDAETSKIQMCRRYIANYEKNICCAMYSNGASRAEIAREFSRYLEAVVKCGISDYAELIDVLSLAILLDVKVEQMGTIMGDSLFDDSLVKALKHYLKSGEPDAVGEDLKFKDHYQIFFAYLKDDSADATSEFLRYINEDWYSSCKDFSWYESHLSKEDTYTGYWCWLAAALLKIKGAGMTADGVKYIPIELI